MTDEEKPETPEEPAPEEPAEPKGEDSAEETPQPVNTFKRTVRYDERRKELHVTVDRIDDNVTSVTEQVYPEHKIKHVWDDLKKRKSDTQEMIRKNNKLISTMNDQIDEFKKLKKPELNERQEQLIKDLTAIEEQKMIMNPKHQIKEAKGRLEYLDENLKGLNKEIEELRSKVKNLKLS